MPSKPLAPDTALSIKIGCVTPRYQYTQDPEPVIAELYATAGDRTDLLTQEGGQFIGFYDDQYRAALVTTLRAMPLDRGEAIALGAFRRGGRRTALMGTHGLWVSAILCSWALVSGPCRSAAAEKPSIRRLTS